MIYSYPDLDDTLFNTAAKCQHPITECSLGAVDNDGEPLSFCSPKQMALIKLLAANGTVIPVTARSHRAFSNVKIKFESYAIINNGATILDSNGSINAEWAEHIRDEVKSHVPLLDMFTNKLNELIDALGVTPSINRAVMDGTTLCYLTVKVNAEDTSELLTLRDAIQAEIDTNNSFSSLKVGVNGRALMVYPPYSSKRRAVEFVNGLLKVTENDLVLGLGDSISDLDFMTSCDFMMIPKHSQINAKKLSEK